MTTIERLTAEAQVRRDILEAIENVISNNYVSMVQYYEEERQRWHNDYAEEHETFTEEEFAKYYEEHNRYDARAEREFRAKAEVADAVIKAMIK